jgi:hypothetical protein
MTAQEGEALARTVLLAVDGREQLDAGAELLGEPPFAVSVFFACHARAQSPSQRENQRERLKILRPARYREDKTAAEAVLPGHPIAPPTDCREELAARRDSLRSRVGRACTGRSACRNGRTPVRSKRGFGGVPRSGPWR